MLRLLLLDLTRQQLVGYRHGGHGTHAGADRKTDHGDDEQFQRELRRHLDFVHADGGEHADFIFALAHVEQGDDHQHDRTDRKHDDQQRQREFRKVVQWHQA